MRFSAGVAREKKIHGLREFLTNRIVSGRRRGRDLVEGGCLPIVVEGGDFRAGRRVLQCGRLGFTAGPPIAVK
jgi:hypothetical protein